MKKLGSYLLRIIVFFSLVSVFSCQLEEKVFLEPIPIALEASDVAATSFQANWRTLLGANEYLLEVSLNPNFSDILEGYPITVTDTNFVVANLQVSQTYFYRIRALRKGTLTDNSQIISVETSSIFSPVALPATEIGPTSFQANWLSTDGADEYLLELSTSPDFSTIVTVTTSDTAYVFRDLEPEQTYYYRLRATDGTSISGLSNVISTLTLGIGVPLPRTASISPIRFTAIWDEIEGATYYELEVAADPDFTQLLYNRTTPIQVNGTVQEVRLYSVRVGKTHYYRVRARSNFSTSAYSEPVTVNTQTLGNCKIEEIFSNLRVNSRVTFNYNGDGTLQQIEWGDGFNVNFRHRLVYSNGKISNAILAAIDGGAENIQQTWEFTYSGDVVSTIKVFGSAGNLTETQDFAYNDSLLVTRFTRTDPRFGGFTILDLKYLYQGGSWTPSSAVDNTNSTIWEWRYDETLSPFVLFDPNVSLLLPIVIESGFASPGDPDNVNRRSPFLGVTNLTRVKPPSSSFTAFEYVFENGNVLPRYRNKDKNNSEEETYTYNTGCGF